MLAVVSSNYDIIWKTTDSHQILRFTLIALECEWSTLIKIITTKSCTQITFIITINPTNTISIYQITWLPQNVFVRNNYDDKQTNNTLKRNHLSFYFVINRQLFLRSGKKTKQTRNKVVINVEHAKWEE